MAIDISIQHIENTKDDIIMKVLRELIWTQKYEIVMMLAELKNKTENMSKIDNNKHFIPTISSDMYPNVLGLTDAYCDGKANGIDISHPLSLTKEISADEWYNETYGGGEQ